MNTHKIMWPALAVFVALILPGFAAGATTPQWFPSAGITVDYAPTFFYNWENGTSVQSTLVNLYNKTEYFVVPSALIYGPTPYNFGANGYVLLAANASMVVRHSYVEASSTTLSRTTELVAGNLTLGGHAIGWVFYMSSLGFTYLPLTTASPLTVDKVGFAQHPNNNDWLDHVDNSLEPGRFFSTYFLVASHTSTQIVLPGPYNETYIAGVDGKVTSFAWINPLSSPGLNAGFVCEVASTGIPGPTIEWLLAAMVAGGCMVAFFARRSIRRKQEELMDG